MEKTKLDRIWRVPAILAASPSADVLAAIGCFHRLNIPDQATQPVQLIEQMQNDRNALVVDAEIRLEIPDQPRPRQVGFRKVKCLLAGSRSQPLRLNPGI